MTVDPTLGTIAEGEVLIEDGAIVAVGKELGVTNAEVIDASGRIVAPGTIDTHRHTWQTQLRGVSSDLSLQKYIFGFWGDATPSYEPEDVYIGELVGALEALHGGVTSILDYAHITNSPDHADSGIEALRASRIRAVFAYGLGQADFMSPPQHDRMADLRRMAAKYAGSVGLVTLGAALSEIGLAPMSLIKAQKILADELGIISTAHVGANWSMPSGVSEMIRDGVIDGR